MNKKELQEFLETQLEHIFGESVHSFKEKVNLLRSINYKRKDKTDYISMGTIPFQDNIILEDAIEDKDSRELLEYCALAVYLGTNGPFRPNYIRFFYTRTMFDRVFPWVVLYKDENVREVNKLTSYRLELKELKEEKFITFALFDRYISLADVLKAKTMKVDLSEEICPDIITGLEQLPLEKINKSMIVAAAGSDSLNRLDDQHKELKKSKSYLERNLKKMFPLYGEFLEMQFQQMAANAFGSKKSLSRSALLELYKDKPFVNQQFFKPALTPEEKSTVMFDTSANESISQEFGKLTV